MNNSDRNRGGRDNRPPRPSSRGGFEGNSRPSSRGGFNGDNSRPEKHYSGAGRRTYGTDRPATPGPRVGAISRDVPPSRRVDAPAPRPPKRNPEPPMHRPEPPRPRPEPPRPRPEPPKPPVPPVEPQEDEHLLVGRNPIREALKAGRPIEKLLVARGDLSGAAQDIIRMAREAGAVVQTVDRSRLDQIYPAHQGMLAYVAAVASRSLDDMFALAEERGEEPFIILLDGVTDPHNLGAIVRSAECAGAHGVILPERRAAGLGPAAAKAAAGALDCIPIARVKNLNRTIDELKERGVWVIGTAMNGEDALDTDLSGPIALVVGSEGDGISHLTLQKCDRVVTLPMTGQIESLNASVAAGVMMYEIVRARKH